MTLFNGLGCLVNSDISDDIDRFDIILDRLSWIIIDYENDTLVRSTEIFKKQ